MSHHKLLVINNITLSMFRGGGKWLKIASLLSPGFGSSSGGGPASGSSGSGGPYCLNESSLSESSGSDSLPPGLTTISNCLLCIFIKRKKPWTLDDAIPPESCFRNYTEPRTDVAFIGSKTLSISGEKANGLKIVLVTIPACYHS